MEKIPYKSINLFDFILLDLNQSYCAMCIYLFILPIF